MSQEGNPITLYKQQGEPQPPECNYLCKEDFVLALQTPLQANMMKKHANGRVICIDSTYRTNGYDFTLISVLIVDEYGEGFPVAWVIFNREDQILLMNFFRALKRRMLDITLAIKQNHLPPTVS